MLSIYMFTVGHGSGHVTRINAVYKGFLRAGYDVEFYATAHRNLYHHYVHPDIKLRDVADRPPQVDVFICDWMLPESVLSPPPDMARHWIGLWRLGKDRCAFPGHYRTIAIEPGIDADVCIWPILSTWEDELVRRSEMYDLLNVESGASVCLMLENGAKPEQVDAVFSQHPPQAEVVIRMSDSPHATASRDMSFYPAARLFRAVDHLVIGAGYNSIHEALCYADLSKTKVVETGFTDDQRTRIERYGGWEAGRGSRSHELARYIVGLLD